MSVTSAHYTLRQFAVFAILTIFALSGFQAFAADCSTVGTKCGIPILFLGSSDSADNTSDLFGAVKGANPSLYTSDVEYHLFYDSRTGKVNIQDENGLNVKPDASARKFVAVWHDGSSTDWRYIDSALAARTPASAKADEVANIVWAIKAATLAPRVIVVGRNGDLAFAKEYVAGKAAPQFGGNLDTYNNDLHGFFSTDGNAAVVRAIDTVVSPALLANVAADQYAGKSLLVGASPVRIAAGITPASISAAPGQNIQFTSAMGPVVWSVLEGPRAGAINANGLFTAIGNSGIVHVVAVSRSNHSVVALSAVALAATTGTPTVATDNESAVTCASAKFNGMVNPNGATGVAGFQYSTNSSFTGAYQTSTTAVSGSTAVPFSLVQTRLTANTTYYVRAFFRNGTTNVTTLGATSSFKSWGCFVNTANASAVTSSDAQLNASVNAGGVAGFVYFAYSPDAFAHIYYTPHISIPGDYTTRPVSAAISMLQTNASYQFKAYFDQSGAGGGVTNGAIMSFTTKGIFAENVKPNWAVNISTHGATFPGKYGTGGAAAEVWLEVSTSPTFANGASVYGAFTVPAGVFAYQTANITISTLSTGTTYYIRYAIKNTETGYTYRYPYTRSFTTLGPQVVSLASSFNRQGIVTDGTSFAKGTAYDGNMDSLSLNLLGSGMTLAGVPFNYGPANALDVVMGSGQTIALPAGNWTTLKLVGSGANGNQSGTFTVHYTDGTSTAYTQAMSDWGTPQGYTGETTAVIMAHRDRFNGKTSVQNTYLYGYSFALNSTKTIQSVTLPANANIDIVAMTIVH